MANLLKIPTWADDHSVQAAVETPRRSSCKLDFDPELRVQARKASDDRPYLSLRLGFIPSTEAEDGDPLDVLLIHDARTYPGVVLRCRPIGIVEVEQRSKGEERAGIGGAGTAPRSKPICRTSATFQPTHAMILSSSTARRTRLKTRSFNSWADAVRPAQRRRSSGCLGKIGSTVVGSKRCPRVDTPTVVALLREYARRTALRGGNPYRAKAYLRAADSLAAPRPPSRCADC